MGQAYAEDAAPPGWQRGAGGDVAGRPRWTLGGGRPIPDEVVSLLAPGRLFTPQQQLRRLENGA